MAIIPRLCPPAFFYLLLSIASLFILGYQNYGNVNNLCIGSYNCENQPLYVLFFVKIFYVIFWTLVLNILCKNGYEIVSWILVFLPFMLLFLYFTYKLMQ